MKTYSFAYGSGMVELPLDEKNVIGELHGNAVAPLVDIRAALWASLDAPIDSAPLCERAKASDTVALVVSDMTRFWMRQDLVVPHLVDYLTERCGVREEDITIVIANGTHIGGDEQELRTLVTDAVYDRVKVKNHDCEAKDLVYLGTTPHGTPVSIDRTAAEADLVVCLGAVTHHVMAGFGGGRKSILPGISGRETIFHNHAFSLDAAQLRSNPAIGNGVLKGNPLHEDMCEAAGLVKNLFIVNLVMNAQMQLAAILSGHYLTSWEAACRMVDRIYQVDVPEKADVIVASCGGFPKDISLYQGTKTIDNIESGLKPGGTLILHHRGARGRRPRRILRLGEGPRRRHHRAAAARAFHRRRLHFLPQLRAGAALQHPALFEHCPGGRCAHGHKGVFRCQRAARRRAAGGQVHLCHSERLDRHSTCQGGLQA